MPPPRIAIATCAGYDDLKVDDRLLQEALATRLAYPPQYVWDGEQPEWGRFDACLVRSTYLRELAAAGVPTVPTVWVEPGDEIDIEVVLADQGWTEAVIKLAAAP